MGTQYKSPAPCNRSKRSIESIAGKVADKFSFKPQDYERNPENLENLVEEVGGVVEFGEEHKESIKIDGKRGFKIYLPFHSSPLRDRFTIKEVFKSIPRGTTQEWIAFMKDMPDD